MESLAHVIAISLVAVAALGCSAAAQVSQGKDARGPLVFACDAGNDLYQVVTQNLGKFPRYDTAAQAVEAARDGDGLLILADGYPQKATEVPAAVFAAAAKKNLRLYVEYPASLAGVEVGKPVAAKAERAVVADDFFGPQLGKLRILAVNGLHFVPAKAAKPHLVAARVAGFDTAVFGLPGQTVPILFELGDGRTMVAATKLSNFVVGRYAPQDGWRTLWGRLLAWLSGSDKPVELKWTAMVTPSYARNDALPADVEKRAFERGADWFINSKIIIPPSMEPRLAQALKKDNLIPPPPADAKIGDGTLGSLEAPLSVIQSDGSQMIGVIRRSDCICETSMALAFSARISGHKDRQPIARNLLDYVYFTSEARKGERGDPKAAAYGHIAWGVSTPSWTVANYGDDNARVMLSTLASAALQGSDRYDEAIALCLLANFRTTGPLGFRPDRIDMPDLKARGWEYYFRDPCERKSPHFEAYLWSCFLWAYHQTGYKPLLVRTEKAIRKMMEAYPDKWEWTNGLAQEKARMLLALAWLVRADDTPEHRAWLKTAVGGLIDLQDPSGAIREELGTRGLGMFPPPESNDAYGTNEASLLQKNGDPVCDLLYTTNFALLGLHEAAAATGDKEYIAAEEKLARFLCRIQVRSAGRHELDGGWFRGFDFQRWEAWASNADAGWGAWAIESGWTQGWITSVLGMRQMKTSLWDLTARSTVKKYFDKYRPLMLPDEVLKSGSAEGTK